MNLFEFFRGAGYTYFCGLCYLEYKELPEDGCRCGSKKFISMETILKKRYPKKLKEWKKRRELLKKKF